MKTHYFLIFYIGQSDKGMVYGNIALEYSYIFPNRNETIEYINESQNVSKSIITSLRRISKSEYEEWIRTDQTNKNNNL